MAKSDKTSSLFAPPQEPGAESLVNQSPADDGVPFEKEPEVHTDALAVLQGRLDKAAEREAKFREERDSLVNRLDDLQGELERQNKLNADLAKKAVGELREPQVDQSMARQVFIAIINGMAAHGDFTIGRQSMNDITVQNAVKHAAGIAQLATVAAKNSRIS